MDKGWCLAGLRTEAERGNQRECRSFWLSKPEDVEYRFAEIQGRLVKVLEGCCSEAMTSAPDRPQAALAVQGKRRAGGELRKVCQEQHRM